MVGALRYSEEVIIPIKHLAWPESFKEETRFKVQKQLYSFCPEKYLYTEDKVRRNKVMEMEVGRADHN